MTFQERLQQRQAGTNQAPASGVSGMRAVEGAGPYKARTPYADAAKGNLFMQRLGRPGASGHQKQTNDTPVSVLNKEEPKEQPLSYSQMQKALQEKQAQLQKYETNNTYSPQAYLMAHPEEETAPSEEQWNAQRQAQMAALQGEIDTLGGQIQKETDRRNNQQARVTSNQARYAEQLAEYEQQKAEAVKPEIARRGPTPGKDVRAEHQEQLEEARSTRNTTHMLERRDEIDQELAKLEEEWRDRGEGQRYYGIINAFNPDYEQKEELSREAYERQRDALIKERDAVDSEYRIIKGRGPYEGEYAKYLNYAEERDSAIKGSDYDILTGLSDFDEKSRADARAEWNDEEAPNYVNEKGYAWEVYDYLNNIDGARERFDTRSKEGYGPEYAKYQLMTDDEIAVYNYLYNTKGDGKALEFLNWMDPKLNKQMFSGRQEAVNEWVGQNAATKIAGSAATIAAMPAREIISAAAGIQDVWGAITGKGIDSYSELSQFIRMVQGVREEVSRDMGTGGTFLYNTAMSAGDSFMNMQMASTLAKAMGYTGDNLLKATNFLGSTLMSSEVFASEVAAGIDKGYKPAEALCLAAIRSGIETATELIGGERVIELIKANPESFLRSMIRGMAPEGLEEVAGSLANEGVNAIWDAVFGTEESYIGQAVKKYKGEDNAGWLVALTILDTELQNFAGGSLASIGSSYVQASNYQDALEYSASKLGTDKHTVVGLMEELGYTDPGKMAFDVDLYGAKDADSFKSIRQRINEIENAVNEAKQKAEEEAKGMEGQRDSALAAMRENMPTTPGTDPRAERAAQEEEYRQLWEAHREALDAGDNETADQQWKQLKELEAEIGKSPVEILTGARQYEANPTVDPRAEEAAQMEEDQQRRENDWYTAPPVEDAQREPTPGVDTRAENDAQRQEEQQARESAWYEAPPVVDLEQGVPGELVQGETPGARETLERETPEEITAEDVRRQEADRRQADENGEGAPFIETGERTPVEEARRQPTPGTDPRQQEAAQLEAERQSAGSDQTENGNAQIENENAQIENRIIKAAENNSSYSINAEDGEYEVLQGPNGNITIRRLTDGKTGDPSGNVYILANSIPLLQTMDPVSTVKGNEIDLGKATASDNIQAFFDTLGNSVYRNGFGEVELDKYGAKSTAARDHHPTRVKIMAVASVPEVIQKGRMIHSEYRKGKMSYTFAAPVDLMGKPCFVAAVVHEAMQDGKPTNKYYLDEIVDTDGFRFNVENKKMPLNPKADPLTKSEDSGSSKASSDNSIPDSAGNSNRNFSTENTRAELEQKEQQEAMRTAAEEFTRGRAIDIMPGEGEEDISSANGLTDEDIADLDSRYDDGGLAALVGDTRAEDKATERATQEGNDALREFTESMPEDPMDLYTEQNPVNSNGGDNNGPKPGYEKMNTERAAEKKTLGQRISDAWHRFIRSMVNEADAIHQAGRATGNKALDGMYFYAKAAMQRAQQWVQGQRMNFDLSESGKGLNEIFDPIRAKGEDYYKKFQLYMYHMLNVERMSRSSKAELEAAQQRVDELASMDQSIATMNQDQLKEKARQYREGGGLGYFDMEENGELIAQYWEAVKERDRMLNQQNKPVFGFDTDADQSRQIARDLLADNPEFEKLAQEVYDYVDALLQYRVDAGLITPEDMNRLKETYPHYIPVMYKMQQEDTGRQKKGNIKADDAIMRAKGGSQEMEPLHLALARQTLAVMKNAGYQQLGSEILKEYYDNRAAMSRYVTDVTENEAVWDETAADNDDVNVPFENVISVIRDGKRYDITLSDDMSYAFKSLQPSKQRLQDWKAMQKANDMFKRLCTAWNPLFMITNPVRDVQDALFYSTDTKRWLKNYPKAISQIAKGGKYWKMYQGMGGVNNSYFDWATGENSGKMGKVEALNMAIEQAPRLAEFMTVLENAERNHGSVTQADLMEAFNAAAEVTTNFGRSGTMGKWINRNLVPFWNPGVQGLSKAVRTVSETKGFKAWANLALKAAALGMLPALLNGLLYKDDDEWDKIDDQMKMEYYLFKAKDGVWIKIPKGRMLAALSMPVVGAQETMRGDDVNWAELGKQAFGSVAPNNPLETNLLSQAIRARLFDKDDPGTTWYGGDIESKRLQSYAPGERYDESTDVISKWLGKKLNLSPKKINYIIDQYSGVIGDLVLPYLTPKAERGISAEIGGKDISLPLSNAFMSRFTLDTVTNNTISGEYYDLLDELGYAAKGGDTTAAIAERFMNRAGGKVSDIYAEIRKIENDPELSDREKTQLTRELRKELNKYQEQVIQDAQAYLDAARKYMDKHPENDYTDDKAVDAWTEGYNSMQTDEKYFIDADKAASKMKDEVYREVNREHFGAEYALEVYNKDVYAKAQAIHDESGLSYDDYYDYYFGTRYLYADKDENGKSISGSKKTKVVGYIDKMDITSEQKDALYLAAGYAQKDLDSTPWHGGSGDYTNGSSSGRSGGSGGGSARSGSGGKTGSVKIPSQAKAMGTSSSKASKAGGIQTSTAEDLIEIIEKYYGGNALAALVDDRPRGRTKVDFKL